MSIRWLGNTKIVLFFLFGVIAGRRVTGALILSSAMLIGRLLINRIGLFAFIYLEYFEWNINYRFKVSNVKYSIHIAFIRFIFLNHSKNMQFKHHFLHITIPFQFKPITFSPLHFHPKRNQRIAIIIPQLPIRKKTAANSLVRSFLKLNLLIPLINF